MSNPPRILAFAGSARAESVNKRLLAVAVEGARAAGARVTLVDLADYPLPLYDQEAEEKDGAPANARRLAELLRAHDGLLVATPEHNGSVSALLKNAIDWASRREKGAESGPFAGKVAGIMSASPGARGGSESLAHLAAILASVGVLVLPEREALPRAGSAFAEDGRLKDGRRHAAVAAIGGRVALLAAKFAG